MNPRAAVDPQDRALIVATQAGLPLVRRPFAAVALRLGISEQEVIERLERLRANGAIRRVAAVANHYRVGVTANAMTVWDVADERVDELGRAVGALDFVSHCYRRPRRLPIWPYNLFAMVHGRSRAETESKIERIAALLGSHCTQSTALYSRRVLKKTGLRLRAADPRPNAAHAAKESSCSA